MTLIRTLLTLVLLSCSKQEGFQKTIDYDSSGGNLSLKEVLEVTTTTLTIKRRDPVEVNKFVLKAFSEMKDTSDSGGSLNKDFIERCVMEKTETYYRIGCDGLTFDYFAAIIGEILYIIQDGASVENRIVFQIKNETIERITDPLPNIFTIKKMAELINIKFGISEYTEETIKAIAHSHYRTILPKNSEEKMIITSGELGRNDRSYQPLATIEWDGIRPRIKVIK